MTDSRSGCLVVRSEGLGRRFREEWGVDRAMCDGNSVWLTAWQAKTLLALLEKAPDSAGISVRWYGDTVRWFGD
jgi:hypothetical protein